MSGALLGVIGVAVAVALVRRNREDRRRRDVSVDRRAEVHAEHIDSEQEAR